MNLQRRDWIAAGMRTMAAKGVEGVRVEPLAVDLGVSKGSFYWHFRNRADLLEAIVATWEQSTISIIEKTEKEKVAPHRLRRLIERVMLTSSQVERALHAWAQQEPAVANRLAAIEQRRIRFLTQLFQEAGFGDEEATLRAETSYLLYLGWINLASRDPAIQARKDRLWQYLSGLLLTPPLEE